jgi:hypothetical protein
MMNDHTHTDDGILDNERQCPTKRIVTKYSRQNIITTLLGIDTLEARGGVQ